MTFALICSLDESTLLAKSHRQSAHLKVIQCIPSLRKQKLTRYWEQFQVGVGLAYDSTGRVKFEIPMHTSSTLHNTNLQYM